MTNFNEQTSHIDLTSDVVVYFTRGKVDGSVSIDFVAKDGMKTLSSFLTFDDEIDWTVDEDVADLLSNEIVLDVIHEYVENLYSNKKEYAPIMGDACRSISRLSKAFEDLLKNPYEFEQRVIETIGYHFNESKRNSHENINNVFKNIYVSTNPKK